MQLKSYTGINEKKKKPKIIQDIHRDLRGKRVLILDDVIDTGDTAEFAREHLLKKKHALEVDIAALTMKTWAHVVPRYVEHATSAWIIFPHEIREIMGILIGKWLRLGWSDSKIKSHLRIVGIEQADVLHLYELAKEDAKKKAENGKKKQKP
jgi:hypoxanthine phosphoribosyltransferase